MIDAILPTELVPPGDGGMPGYKVTTINSKNTCVQRGSFNILAQVSTSPASCLSPAQSGLVWRNSLFFCLAINEHLIKYCKAQVTLSVGSAVCSRACMQPISCPLAHRYLFHFECQT